MFPFTPTGQSVLDILALFNSLYGCTSAMPTTWEEFFELCQQFPELEELYQQFF